MSSCINRTCRPKSLICFSERPYRSVDIRCAFAAAAALCSFQYEYLQQPQLQIWPVFTLNYYLQFLSMRFQRPRYQLEYPLRIAGRRHKSHIGQLQILTKSQGCDPTFLVLMHVLFINKASKAFSSLSSSRTPPKQQKTPSFKGPFFIISIRYKPWKTVS